MSSPPEVRAEIERILSRQSEPLSSGIQLDFADALYRHVSQHKPTHLLEIGMAQGVSTLALLFAVRNHGGHVTSIDPHQSSYWKSVGLRNINDAGLAQYHTLIEKPDYVALPSLLASGARFQFAYIDGWHTFDYTLLDFFYIDKMMDPGGVVAFNDCSLASVHKVTRFVTRHRAYSEIDAGLGKRYVASNLVKRAVRRILDRQTQDRYFLKQRQWEPEWNFFKAF